MSLSQTHYPEIGHGEGDGIAVIFGCLCGVAMGRQQVGLYEQKTSEDY
jgi:hypothetical protein